MNDMSSVIIAKADELTADDLLTGPRTIRITGVDIRPGTERPVTISFEGDEGKPLKPCKTVSRVLVAGWGPDATKYVGRSVTVYRDPRVKWGGLAVGGVRISHMSDLEREMILALTATKGKKEAAKILPLKLEAAQQRQTDPNAAEKWANDHIGFVAGSADLERLAAIQAQGKKAMDKLAGSNPELHAKVTAAYSKRFGELSNSDGDDDPFEAGRPDADMGDGFDGDEQTNEQEGN